jgi:hypothetical protein
VPEFTESSRNLISAGKTAYELHELWCAVLGLNQSFTRSLWAIDTTCVPRPYVRDLMRPSVLYPRPEEVFLESSIPSR